MTESERAAFYNRLNEAIERERLDWIVQYNATEKGHDMPMTNDEIQLITDLATQIAEIEQAQRDLVPHVDQTYHGDAVPRWEILKTNWAIARARLDRARDEIVKANLARDATPENEKTAATREGDGGSKADRRDR